MKFQKGNIYERVRRSWSSEGSSLRDAGKSKEILELRRQLIERCGVVDMAVEHTFIHKHGKKTKQLTGMSAIREKCLECSAWRFNEVRDCPSKDCALYPFRFGRYPKKTGAS
jgi:hypothetical protein